MSRATTEDIVNDISGKRRIPRATIESICSEFLHIVATNLIIGNSVNLKRIGTLTPKKRFVERSPESPVSIKFTISKILKENLNH